MTELENIPGTGNEGRVTKKDILQYVSQRKSGVGSRESGVSRSEMIIPVSKVEQQQTNSNQQITTYTGNVEIIETFASFL